MTISLADGALTGGEWPFTTMSWQQSPSGSRVSLRLAKVPAILRFADATGRGLRRVQQAGGLLGQRKPEAYATTW